MKKEKRKKKMLKKLKRENAVLREENQLLKEAVLQAENASKTKSAFLSHMSHDIRTPMNGIIGMTSIALKNSEDRERVFDCLKKIDSSSKHLVSLINDILDMGRIESGRMVINHEPLDMQEVINSCAFIAESLLSDRKVDFVRGFGVFKHPVLLGDELHLRQILINILGNAIKFTPDGGKIYFQVKEISSEYGKTVYHFEIEDTGIGMKPDFLKRIWDSFTQENSGSCSGEKGTGLGMAITKKLVDLMGGVIKVESELGVGSKFVVEMTFDIGIGEKRKVEIIQEPEISLDGMKVLLVEDIETNMEIAKIMLEDAGIDVTTAENGQIAVNIFNNSPAGAFDAILMDLRMPVMDGLAATKTMRALPRTDAATVPIIAMTADAYEEDVRKTKDTGMNAHLAKPINQEELLQTLKNFYKATGCIRRN